MVLFELGGNPTRTFRGGAYLRAGSPHPSPATLIRQQQLPFLMGVDLFIARQPIFDAASQVMGYELLFRDGLTNCFAATDGNEATRQVLLNTFVLFGLSRLTGGRPAFINFTRDYLLNDLVRLFPPHSVVVEILEDILPDQEVIAACRALKADGYTLALDDVTGLERYGELLDIADMIKVDFMLTGADKRCAIAKQLLGRRVRLLAEKVETREEFAEAANEGFSLFQGYFFSRPEIVRRRDVSGNRGQYLRLLRELRKPDVSVNGLERIIKQDLSLSYRLLKYINSPLFGLRSEIRSVRHALTLLGERDVRRWAMLAALHELAPDKPSELLQTGLLRAKFCETLASVIGSDAREVAEEMFLVGLFSVLDGLLDVPLDEAVRDIGVPARVKAALLGAPGPLRTAFELENAYERGDWDRAASMLEMLNIDPRAVSRVFLDSVDWANHATRAQSDGVWSSLPPSVVQK